MAVFLTHGLCNNTLSALEMYLSFYNHYIVVPFMVYSGLLKLSQQLQGLVQEGQ